MPMLFSVLQWLKLWIWARTPCLSPTLLAEKFYHKFLLLPMPITISTLNRSLKKQKRQDGGVRSAVIFMREKTSPLISYALYANMGLLISSASYDIFCMISVRLLECFTPIMKKMDIMSDGMIFLEQKGFSAIVKKAHSFVC